MLIQDNSPTYFKQFIKFISDLDNLILFNWHKFVLFCYYFLSIEVEEIIKHPRALILSKILRSASYF